MIPQTYRPYQSHRFSGFGTIAGSFSKFTLSERDKTVVLERAAEPGLLYWSKLAGRIGNGGVFILHPNCYGPFTDLPRAASLGHAPGRYIHLRGLKVIGYNPAAEGLSASVQNIVIERLQLSYRSTTVVDVPIDRYTSRTSFPGTTSL